MLERRVLKVRMHGDTEIGGKRPGRRCPDQDEDFPASQRGIDQRRVATQGKLNVDRWTGVLLVFNFGFGKRSLIVNALVHGPRTFVDVSTFNETTKKPRRLGLIMVRHREVRIVPFPEDAQPLKITRLAL